MSKLKLLACSAILTLTVLAGPAPAQYIYLDANGDGVNTPADTLNSSGPTVLTIYLNTNRDKDGSPQTCNSHTAASCGATPTAQPLNIFSYQVYLSAVGGTVTWGTFTPDSSAFYVAQTQLQDTHDVEFTSQRQPAGSVSPPGLRSLGKIPATITSGSPNITFRRFPNTPLDRNSLGTSFGTTCTAFALGNTYVLGDRLDPCGTVSGLPGDWYDADGIGQTTPALPPPYPLLTSKFLLFQTDDQPYGLTSADLNADGRPDIAAVSSNVVNIYIAQGDGAFLTYKERVNYATGSAPRSVEAADFNGDGKRDLVVSNRTSNTVSVFLGNGDGTFGAKTDFAVGTNPEVVGVADFNGDGKRDVAVTNNGSNTVSVLLGNGDGTLGVATAFATGTGPIGLVAADISGSGGAVDLIVANSSSNTVSVLRGNGNGTFAAKVDYATGATPYAVTLAQLNGAGGLDVAVANQSGMTVSVLLGFGNDSLGAKSDFACAGSPTSVTSADFNGDGRRDIVTANSGTSNDYISLLLGNGDGTFAAPTTIHTGPRPQAVINRDLNADARPDLVVANRFGHSMAVLFGNWSGTFGTATSVVDISNGGPTNVFLADVNGDSKLDALVTHYNTPYVSMFPGSGTGTFGTRTDIALGTSGGGATADVNNDTKQDLITVHPELFSEVVKVSLGNGDGTFNTPTSYVTADNPKMVAVGDFNGDGLKDLAVAGYSNVSVHLGIGGGAFAARMNYATNIDTRWIIAQDVTGDGALDLVVSDYGSGSVGVLSGVGNGTFASEVRFGVGSTAYLPWGLALGDVTGDGRPDVVSANSGSSHVALLVNTGLGFGPPTAIATGASPTRVSLADMNGDGKLDIVAADSTAYAVSVLFGAGNGTFSNRKEFGAGRHLPGLAVGDLDGNGLPDVVVVTAEFTPTVNTLLNRYTLTGVTESPVSARVSLTQNYPNPFNPSTTIKFTLERAGRARLRVFDVGGRLLTTLIDRDLPTGPSSVQWNGRNRRGLAVASGVYFYQLEANGTKVAKRMVLAR